MGFLFLVNFQTKPHKILVTSEIFQKGRGPLPNAFDIFFYFLLDAMALGTTTSSLHSASNECIHEIYTILRFMIGYPCLLFF